MTATVTPGREMELADISAGNAFRDTLVPRADRGDSFSPAWYGWALMDAFLAGAAHARLAAKPADDGVRAEAYHECADIAARYDDCGGQFIAEKIRDAATALSTTGEPNR